MNTNLIIRGSILVTIGVFGWLCSGFNIKYGGWFIILLVVGLALICYSFYCYSKHKTNSVNFTKIQPVRQFNTLSEQDEYLAGVYAELVDMISFIDQSNSGETKIVSLATDIAKTIEQYYYPGVPSRSRLMPNEVYDNISLRILVLGANIAAEIDGTSIYETQLRDSFRALLELVGVMKSADH